MKLLFDQNLSPALGARMVDVFPQSLHVRDIGLQRAPDAIEALLRMHSGRIASMTQDGTPRFLMLL